MRERRWGRIVNIGGMTARIVAPIRITNGIVNAGVANFTKRDAEEFLQLAAEIPITTVVDKYPLADVNLALRRLKTGEVNGAAVLIVR